MVAPATSQRTVWRDRFAALRNVPPVLRLVWNAAPKVVASGLILRMISALLPVAALAISKLIIDLVVAPVKTPGPFPNQVWFLLGAEFMLAALGNVLGRAID